MEPYLLALAELIDQFTPTCQMLQAYLASIPADTQQCSRLNDELLVGQCGCGGNETVVVEEVELCQVCSGENDVFAVPDRDVSGVIQGLGADMFFPSGTNMTCANLFQHLSSQSSDHLLCQNLAKLSFQGVCECPWKSPNRHCSDLLNCDVDSFKPDLRLDFLTELFGFPFTPTCHEMLWIAQGWDEVSTLTWFSKDVRASF